jgi:hypothetical protein
MKEQPDFNTDLELKRENPVCGMAGLRRGAHNPWFKLRKTAAWWPG